MHMLSLVGDTGGCSLVEVHRLLTEVASLVTKHQGEGARASVVQLAGLAVLQHMKACQTRDQTCVPCVSR